MFLGGNLNQPLVKPFLLETFVASFLYYEIWWKCYAVDENLIKI